MEGNGQGYRFAAPPAPAPTKWQSFADLSRSNWGRSQPIGYVPTEQEVLRGFQFRIAEALESIAVTLRNIDGRLRQLASAPTEPPKPTAAELLAQRQAESLKRATEVWERTKPPEDPIPEEPKSPYWTLNTSAWNACEKLGCKTWADIASKTKEDFYAVHQCGVTTVYHIRGHLTRLGLCFADERPDPTPAPAPPPEEAAAHG